MNKHIKFAEKLTSLLDTKFSLFGIRFGIDPLLDIFPIIGDHIAALLSLYMIWIGLRIGMPLRALAMMLWNICIDYLIGLIPFIGIIGDIWYKSNVRNLELIKRHIGGDVLIGEVVK